MAGRQATTVAIHAIRAGSTGNLFLDSLPLPVAERFVPALTRVDLPLGKVLSHPGVPAEHVYFPIRSLISTVSRMADGSAVEVAIAGPEGFSSMSFAFGSRVSPHTTVVQIADSAYCVSAPFFIAEIAKDAGCRERVASFAEYIYLAAAQFAACNRLHSIEQRYARWLLMAEDRVGAGEFVLTQEYSAQMLGVRRAGVTVVAGVMTGAGLISHRRSHITVLDRRGLEEMSCECYRAANDELERLMGFGLTRGASGSGRAGDEDVVA